MQVVILAGGLGTRLKPLTLKTPKPMVPILGKPYLYYQLEYLKRQGIKEALLLVGYLGEQIRDYFGSGNKVGMRLEYSEEKELLGTAGAIKLAEGKIHEDFIVIYGDSFLPLDYGDFESAFNRSSTEGMIAVYEDPSGSTDVKKNVALSANGLVSYYEKGGASEALNYVEAGVMAFRRDVLRRIPPRSIVSIEKDIYPELIREGKLSGYITKTRFFDIGTKERVEELEAWLKNGYLKNTFSG